MTTYSASIKKALAAQTDLVNHSERCSADPEKLASIGRSLGHQVRVKRNSTQYALYTVSEVRQENPDNIVRMGQAGRQRLGTTNEFSGTVDSQVPHLTYTDEQAEANSEFVERFGDNGTHTGLIALAPHGGMIENWTDEQAERVASQLAPKGVSSWRCKGWLDGGGAFTRWHITSTDIHEASFPLLGTVVSRGFTHAVAFHGFGDPDVLVGGLAPTALKESIKAAIEAALAGSGITVRVAQPGENYGGDSPQNIVNRITSGGASGVQIEQSTVARTDYWQAIADAVASVYDPLI
jgi:phage replication-related protein YjqB (UPF0714/DUF867 family)